MADLAARSLEERVGLLVARALPARAHRRLTTRLRQAKLRQTAGLEDMAYRHPHGWAKAGMARLATWQWVREPPNVVSTGPTGLGTTWLGWAVGPKAWRAGLTALSLRRPRCLPALARATGAGR
jgi:DNA replication protein DnaC